MPAVGVPRNNVINEPYTRTMQEFVEDLVTEGRSDLYILAVVQSTRWQTYKEEIKIKLKQFRNVLNNRK